MFRPIDRRTFLRAATDVPKRMVTICNTLGLHKKQSLFPETPGALFST